MAEQKDQKDQKKGTSESTKSPSTDLEKKMDKLSTQEDFKPTLSELDEGVTVDVQQADPNSPLYSAKSFEELKLSKELLDGVYAMGFKKPSKIQESALPLILANQNLIAQAQSGTGKTAAFVLGILSKCNSSFAYPQALCVCPTRELARQIIATIKNIGRFTKLTTCLVSGEENFSKKISNQIVVGTPGKIIQCLEEKLIIGRDIKILVLDEADFLIEGSLGEQTKKLKRHLPPNCQYLLFSATFREDVYAYATRLVPSPRAEIILKKEELSIKGIKQYYIMCPNEEGKFKVLSDIYGFLTIGQSIIFCDTRKNVYALQEKMQKDGHKVGMFTRDLTAEERDKIIDAFRNARIKVLIATDVLGRGVDILGVTLVVNYELPYTPNEDNNRINYEQYLHRIGRSGRFGRKGIAINLICDEKGKKHIGDISNHFQRKIEEYPADKLDELGPLLEQVISKNQREMLERVAKEKQKYEEENAKKSTSKSPQISNFTVKIEDGKRSIQQTK